MVQSARFVASIGSAGLIGAAVLVFVPGGFLIAIVAGGLIALGVDSMIKNVAGQVYDKLIR